MAGLVGLLLVAAAVSIFSHARRVARTKPTKMAYSPPTNVTNKFLATFEKVMASPDLNLPQGWDSYVPLVLNDGKVLCRKSHMEVISNARVRHYINVLRLGLRTSDAYHAKGEGVPVILVESDGNGCDAHDKRDHIGFPRLTWSFPSPSHGEGWCAAMGMVGYEQWNAFRTKRSRPGWLFDRTWDKVFRNDERNYPWDAKIETANWRGSTTGPGANFSDLARARLVQRSIERPDLIDAGFTAFVEDWAPRQEELSKQTRVAGRIRFVDQMRYRAVIDIDGNNWSARFVMLLCMNSVVIKVDPDYVEYFYSDLKPMVHYVPASLENITEVAAYVLDTKNRKEMKRIVESANAWCRRTNTREQLPMDAVSRLEQYEVGLHDAYGDGWIGQWRGVQDRIQKNIGADLEECIV